MTGSQAVPKSCPTMKWAYLHNDTKPTAKFNRVAEFRSVVKDTKSNTKHFTKSISIHSDYQSVHFW